MKHILLAGFLLSMASAHALVDEKIVEECKEAAVSKLVEKASLMEAELDELSIEKLDEEKRILATSHFVWFKADAYRKDDKSRIFVTTLMEKPVLPLKKPCF